MLLNGVNNAPVQTSFKTNTPVGSQLGANVRRENGNFVARKLAMTRCVSCKFEHTVLQQ